MQRIQLNKYKMVVTRKVENKCLFQRQCSFGEGESVGHTLALLAKANSASSNISTIKRPGGEISPQTSGPDELPAELYKQYGKVLLPELLKALEWVTEGGRLLSSMSEATIIVLQKEGEDQLDTSSFRLISLLSSDVKILARVMAARLNISIQKCIHPDQSVFIPNRSTSTNIRWVYLNLQTPTENTGPRAILSLDAAKAFDSLESIFGGS